MAKRRRMAAEKDYAISKETSGKRLAAPRLPYQPGRPRQYAPRIGVIGCGGIIPMHLKAYRKARYQVVALADPAAASVRSKSGTSSIRVPRCIHPPTNCSRRDDIDVVDIATHPEVREQILLAAIRAGKHVLSQKPFVTDLAAGRRIVAAAKRKGVQLAVNQNGRWAAHVSYARQAIAAGLLGEVTSVDMEVCWDHNWVTGTPFEDIHHLLLFDFGIHWFDMAHCYIGQERPKSVFASVCRTRFSNVRAHRSRHRR